jgi:hypothetical protein
VQNASGFGNTTISVMRDIVGEVAVLEGLGGREGKWWKPGR